MKPSTENCATCPVRPAQLERLGVDAKGFDSVIALAGNPNTGKSTVFNALTGLRQHTGNWPGKTIARAEGAYSYGDRRYKIVDLPGTYSLLSASPDEEVTRDFLLFGKPDVTVIVTDASALERNLNLVLQVMEITPRCVLALNLMDEARARGLAVDARGLARDLGIPVVPMAARNGEGMENLLKVIGETATREPSATHPMTSARLGDVEPALDDLTRAVITHLPGVANPRWIALRLLGGDARITIAVASGELTQKTATPPGDGENDISSPDPALTEALLAHAARLRWDLPPDFHDRMTEAIYAESSRLCERNVSRSGANTRAAWESKLDQILTSRHWGLLAMALVFAAVLWITITGANIPSEYLSNLLVAKGQPALHHFLANLGFPNWLTGILADGMYLTSAWVVSVMLPPMAIFFPLFTLLEDLGYLPRVAFNLDRFFQRSGAHGKQALTMAMGFGCNAAGVVAARVIDSPRERLIAIITNNFALCNGRWPTQILMATVFLGAAAPASYSNTIAALGVSIIAALGVGLSLASSWFLSRTVLRGEASTFSLELPPYRPPAIWRTLYTSLIDRTLFVLWRAVVFALPAGAAIWLAGNIQIGGQAVGIWLVDGLDPMGRTLGLNGVIIVAYIVAIPANEIVVPTILMLTVLMRGLSGVGEQGAGVIFETAGNESLRHILAAGGWTTMTAVCLMLFSLCHNPCSTTLYTIYKETGSLKWTTVSALLPLVIGVVVCMGVAFVWRMAGG